MDCELRPLNALVWREDLYPRSNPDPQTIQRYAADLDVLPPVEVNQHNEIIDGYHRWTAHKKANAQEIRVVVTTTASDIDLLRLATLRNAAHGLQLSQQDKKDMAVRFYSGGTGMTKEDIAKTLSVSVRMVNSYLSDIDRALNEKRDRTIREMWMACYTQDEIADAVGVSKSTVHREVESTFPFGKVEGKDGKERPAVYKPRKSVFTRTTRFLEFLVIWKNFPKTRNSQRCTKTPTLSCRSREDDG